jgi:hypothetical protein
MRPPEGFQKPLVKPFRETLFPPAQPQTEFPSLAGVPEVVVGLSREYCF